MLALTSCSSKLGELSADNFTVTPNPLESRGGPEKYLKKKAVVTVVPELRYGDGQVAQGQAATFQGEKVEGNDQTISYKMGGNYTMKSNFKYVPEMHKSDLYMTFDAYYGKKKKKIEVPAVKVAEGVISTSELYKNTLAGSGACIAPDTFQRVRAQKQEAQIKFLINQANIRKSELKNNSVEEFVNLLKKINEDKEGLNLKNVEVLAYASPDGAVGFNDKLAGKRQNVSVDYAEKQLDGYSYDLLLDQYGYVLGIKNVTSDEDTFFVVGYENGSSFLAQTVDKALVIFPDDTISSSCCRNKFSMLIP